MKKYKDFDAKVEWVYCDDCGMGQFMIARAVGDSDSIAFVYLDKYGYYNVFRTMDEYSNYVQDDQCERICVGEEDYPYDDLPEGVDAIDAWMYDNLPQLYKVFESVEKSF